MTENISPLRTINELLGYSFFIPSYQRGYRWSSEQVEDLLKDIKAFSEKPSSDSKTWYCLQPLIVKKCDSIVKRKFNLTQDSEWYEVIDGQQRLTTIFLIVHYMNERWSGQEKYEEFSLKYQTRPQSESFLEKLAIDNTTNDIKIDESNIDFSYISKAYKAIHSWVELERKKGFDKRSFESNFLHHTKVIWYETDFTNSIEIFTRINMGKIRLTNAELIKALFLNSSNFRQSDNDAIRLKQLEIASEWDRMEYALQNDTFWYFLNKGLTVLPTRFEFIFDLMSNKSQEDDENFTFRYFSEKFKNVTDEDVANNWKDIKEHYQTLEEWFENREFYHKIGFLVTIGTELKTLVRLKNGKSKLEFKDELDKLIVDKVNKPLNDLKYGKNNSVIKTILLFHNIQTMLNYDSDTSRFPFDRYKEIGNWDIEHIHATAEYLPTDKQHRIDWLNDSLNFIDSNKNNVLHSDVNDFIGNYDNCIKNDESSFNKLATRIINYFSAENTEIKDNDISNLALLDSNTNRSYKNAVFPVKRSEIIKKEKEGTFIPICTKNVFMKLYSEDISQMTFWGSKDSEAYENDIRENIKKILPNSKSIN